MTKRIIIYLCCLTLTLLLCLQNLPAATSRPTSQAKDASYSIRVAVIRDAQEISLKIKGSYRIYALPLLDLLREGKALRDVVIRPTYSGISMAKEDLKIYGVKIKAEEVADIYVDGRRFRGEIDIMRTENLKLLVINRLAVEDYVKGVLYHEVSHRWPMEALKAQAIAARTYAIYKSKEMKDKDYDLTRDIYSQVYGGRTSERSRTNKAVEKTRGKILEYNGEVLPAYFHAACGGHTEDASLLWNTNVAPLKGRSCKYCESSPHYRWTREVSLNSIEKLLNNAGHNVRGIKEIRITSRDASGRIETVSISSSSGVRDIPSSKFRLALGPNLIRSTNFTADIKGGIAIFNGKGWGHGAGMCQWGAHGMARRRLKATEILNFYYPGARIVDLEDVVKR